MPWKKSSPALVRRFESACPEDAAIVPKKMFGYPATFVNGNFFVGLHQDDVVMRLPEAQKGRLPALAGAGAFDPMGGRPMKDWWVVPPPVVGDEAQLRSLLVAALALVKDLPAKPTKGAAAKKKPPAPTKGTKRAGRK